MVPRRRWCGAQVAGVARQCASTSTLPPWRVWARTGTGQPPGRRHGPVLADRTTGRIDPRRTGPEAPLEPRPDQPLRLLAPGVLGLQVRGRVQNRPDVLLAPGLDRPLERVRGARRATSLGSARATCAPKRCSGPPFSIGVIGTFSKFGRQSVGCFSSHRALPASPSPLCDADSSIFARAHRTTFVPGLERRPLACDDPVARWSISASSGSWSPRASLPSSWAAAATGPAIGQGGAKARLKSRDADTHSLVLAPVRVDPSVAPPRGRH